jgi:hydrogenase expression/formation protein HypC
MCLGVPALVLEKHGNIGKVDFGGSIREVDLSLVDAKVGDYVVVHAGFAIQLLDAEEARSTLQLFKEILEEGQKVPHRARGKGKG